MIQHICLTSHGDELLDENDDKFEAMRKKLYACGLAARDINKLVVITPHNLRSNDHILLVNSERVCDAKWCYNIDRYLTHDVFLEAKTSDIPVIKVNYGTESGKESVIPLDWGSSIPLSFYDTAKELVIISPGRTIGRSTLFNFGKILVKVLNAVPDKIGIIVSADHAHTHLENGPYGFSPMAVQYDKAVMDFLLNDDASVLLNMDEKIVEGARPDSYWQLLILAGIINCVNTIHDRPIYGIAGYYSMIVLEYKLTYSPR
jgi:aromatic ring-opening dioxygenase LigB subunit